MGMTDFLRNWFIGTDEAERSFPLITLDDYITQYLHPDVLPYRLNQTISGTVEQIDASFAGYVQGGYQHNGIVFAAMVARASIFSQARIMFQELRNGKPGDVFGTPALDILRNPWPGGTSSDLLARASLDVDNAGNFFAVRRGDRIKRLRPDWVDIVLGSPNEPNVEAGDIDAEVLGYVYYPGGRYSERDPEFLLREQVGHFAPYPDPLAEYRGMSWLTPIIREVQADSAATQHKVKFFENGATPNMVVTVDIDEDKFDRFVEAFERNHKGVANASKTLYLMAGTTVDVVGKDLKEMDFRVTQGAGEVRIANASGMHAVILGLSEGLQGSSLNQGNFGAARRLVADKTMWFLWENFCGSMETIVPPPQASRLWIDAAGIPFLREDAKDAAEIQAQQAVSIRQLVDAGFKPETVVDAVIAGDYKRLAHTGLFSVQLQPPGSANPTTPAPDAPGRGLIELLEGTSR